MLCERHFGSIINDSLLTLIHQKSIFIFKGNLLVVVVWSFHTTGTYCIIHLSDCSNHKVRSFHRWTNRVTPHSQFFYTLVDVRDGISYSTFV